MDSNGHWKHIQKKHPKAHKALQHVASFMFERKEDPISIGVLDTQLGVADELGLVEINDEKVSFFDSDVRDDYLVQHAADAILSVWHNEARSVEAFSDVQHRIVRLTARNEACSEVLLILANEHDKDVVKRMATVARLEGQGRHHPVWELYFPFCNALPHLEVDATSLADALEPVLEVTGGDGAAGLIYKAVEQLAGQSAELADELYSAFVQRPESPVIALTGNALLGLSTFDLDEVHQRALELTRSEELVLRRVGIDTLGRLKYSPEKGNLLQRTVERLEELRKRPNPETDYILVEAYGNLRGQVDVSEEALVELSSRSDPRTQHHVARVLRVNDDALSQAWYKDALLNLASIPSSNIGTLDMIDLRLSRLAEESPNTALAFAKALVTSRNYGREESKSSLPEVLDSTVQSLRKHHLTELEVAITEWFASKDPRLHRAARDIVDYHYHATSDTQRPIFTLSKKVLDDLDEQQVVDTLKRIMGYVSGSRMLAALLSSALRREPYSDALAQFVTNALSGYVLYNYPMEAGEYIERRLDGETLQATEQTVLEEALRRNKSYRENRQNLPELKELRPPSQRLHLLQKTQRQQQAKLMQEARKSSPMMNLFRELPLKYGRGFFVEQNGEFMDPTPLNSYSTEAEVPRGEAIDPVGQIFQRLQLQHAGLESDRDEPHDRPEDEA